MRPSAKSKVASQRERMLLWTQLVLARQVALHQAQSTNRDSDQLIWALASVLRFRRDYNSSSAEQDLVRAAIPEIFSTQLKTGMWPRFQPLFHYQNAGNAYCFIFESLAVLLGEVLEDDEGFARRELRAQFGGLERLFSYAEATKILMESSVPLRPSGWCSGHRPNVVVPESWATASVMLFAERLRRLVGTWTREFAVAQLGASQSSQPQEEALQTIAERGNTWSESPASADLLELFVNPAIAGFYGDGSDPDKRVIPSAFSRAAILYGPPGTSKTTLCRSIARAIGWAYVELHASHFVSEGLPGVQRRANEIFEWLMEINRAVVLFDEIDELVRDREEGSQERADVFGRFLTTSMLPKLAELWRQARVLYFVATNHVRLFDAAVVRSERFDATMFVAPPAFKAKKRRLEEILKKIVGSNVSLAIRKETFEKSLEAIGQGKKERAEALPKAGILAKFVLMRWDQLEELAFQLASQPHDANDVIDDARMAEALENLADPRLGLRATYLDYRQDRGHSRRDYNRQRVWRVRGNLVDAPIGQVRQSEDGKLWLAYAGDRPPDRLGGSSLELTGPGDITATPL